MRLTEAEYEALVASRVQGRPVKKNPFSWNETIRQLSGESVVTHPAPKRTKYGNKKCQYGGAVFDSIGEKDRWIELETLQSAGAISELRRQVPFEIIPVLHMGGKRVAATVYRADFTYKENGALVVEDWKSGPTKTAEYKLKRKLMLHVHGITIKETGR